jgi:hypothetical protein
MTTQTTHRQVSRLTADDLQPGALDARYHLHWETALDRLELEVILVERLLTDPSWEHEALDPWDEPQLTGPIPTDLVDRAVEIRHRQQRAERALAPVLDRTRRQHRFADRVDRATGAPSGPAIYVDVDA